MNIRHERNGDVSSIRALNRAAFKTAAEADLVDGLREAVESCISLVAEEGVEVVGHIFFSPVSVHPEEGPTWPALALGPMAVTPSHQDRGIGSALVRAGLHECRESDKEVVFVLGHPQFYPRFGFQPARPLGFECQWNVPDEVFMVAEVSPGALHARRGRVTYHDLFDAV